MRLSIACLRGVSLARALIVSSVAAVGMLLSACQGAGYLQHGIGTQLAAPDIVQSTALQDRYFQLLCQQAGYSSCVLPTFDRGMWTLIVYQGMNDIDRRCDAYLAWLDDRKRSRGPWTRQIADMRSATTTILTVVDPRSAAALQIVAVAFDLITNSLENYHSRLLLEMESSTINAVVINARNDFRAELAERNLSFSNRPDAEYALREYLRRCLPFAIETQINDLSTLGSRGIEGRGNSIFQPPVLGAQLLHDVPDSPEDRIEPTPPPRLPEQEPPFDPMGHGKIEQGYSKAGVQELQRKLCVTASGRFDNATRAAIGVVEDAIASSSPNNIIDTGTEDAVIRGEVEGCQTTQYQFADIFEKFHFRGDDTSTTKTKIERFQSGLYACAVKIERRKAIAWGDRPATEDAAKTGTLDSTTRSGIIFVNGHIKLGDGEQPSATGTLTVGVIRAIQDCILT